MREANTPFEDTNLDVSIPETGSSGTFIYSATGETLGSWDGDPVPEFTADGNTVAVPGGIAWSADAKFTPESTLSGFTNEFAQYSYYAGSSPSGDGFLKGTIVRDYGGSVTAENVNDGFVYGYVDFSGNTVPGTGAMSGNVFRVTAISDNFYARANYGNNGVAGVLNNDGSFSLTKAQLNTSPSSCCITERSGIGLGNPCASPSPTTSIPDADLPDNMNVTGQVVGSNGQGIVGAYAIDRSGGDGNWAAFGVFGAGCPSSSPSYCP